MKKVCLTLVAVLAMAAMSVARDIAVPDGYAEYAGTTGGGDATPDTVSTASEFRAAVNTTTPAVIIVKGRLNVGDVDVRSNKTIVGANSDAGLYGGTIEVDGSNYIFQNLTFGPADGDVMEVSGGTKVFITKCEFYGSSDELLSIVREADYVTVSWCKFHFRNPDSHSFGHLIGNRDDRTSDRGKLHVTMHHNWYDDGVHGRMPRVRYGHVHIYNNYWNSSNTNYCIGIGVECHIRLENSHFDHVDDPWADYGGTDNGEIGWNNLLFEGSTQPTFMPNAYPVFTPPYDFSLDSVDNVKTIVTTYAGNISDTSTAIEREDGKIPASISLHQNYPNPFNPTTTINFALSQAGQTTITVINGKGQVVSTLMDRRLDAGSYSVDFNGSQFSSGIYFYRLRSGHFTMSNKMLLLK